MRNEPKNKSGNFCVIFPSKSFVQFAMDYIFFVVTRVKIRPIKKKKKKTLIGPKT